MRWELDAEIPTEIINNLNHLEGKFLVNYDKLVEEYINSVGLDLTTDIQPPKEPFIIVRVLQECQLTNKHKNNTLTLKQNTTHFLKRNTVEPLIRAGYLEHIV